MPPTMMREVTCILQEKTVVVTIVNSIHRTRNVNIRVQAREVASKQGVLRLHTQLLYPPWRLTRCRPNLT